MASRLIDPPFHGVLDYQTAALFQGVPKLLDLEGTTAGKLFHAFGAVHGGYSLFTDYELGAVKAIPFGLHLKLDWLWTVGLAASPFVTGEYKKGTKRWLPHVLFALYEATSLLMSEPGEGNHGVKPKGEKTAVADAPHAFPDGGPDPARAPRPLQPEGSQTA
ncbi:MAG TPA: hypothetical protein VGV67_00050 [Solirubrobacteraceae bacterium]|nr:hypothetical protein [Solirubrobacteraceae bacterium]